METFSFVIEDPAQAGQRLDKALLVLLPDQSRSRLGGLIRAGHVLVNGKASKSSHMIRLNDVISGSIVATSTDLKGEKMDFDVLFEDDDMLAINKPAGVTVHPPNARENTGTLVNGLIEYLGKDLSAGSAALRPGIVHRLDKDTSGILLVAKNDVTHAKLAAIFEKHDIEKKYMALICGRLVPDKGTIDAPIGRSPRNRKKMAISGNHGKHAITKYQVKEHLGDDYTLVEVMILTGRTHQIRVHFAAIGHPVVGDPVYGDIKVNALFVKEYALKRQFLHAFSLKFRHPITKKALEVHSALPQELSDIVQDLRDKA